MTSCALSNVDPLTSNLHCHTQFCDGHDTMEAFVTQAISSGITTLGFTPHSPVPLQSPCNMPDCDVAAYFSEIDRLRQLYGHSITLLAGMEIDYLGSDWGPCSSYFDSLPLDYRIASVHFIPDFDGNPIDIDGRVTSFNKKMAAHFRNDIRYVVQTFFDRSMEMVEAGHFDILGHADKIARNASHFSPGIEDEPWFIERVRALLSAAISKGIAVEINTKVLDDAGRTFPRERFFSLLLDSNARIFINSDSHVAANIDSGRRRAISMLAEAGLFSKKHVDEIKISKK